MRTTVTLDSDTEELLRQRMQTEQISFKEALNDAIRNGLQPPNAKTPFATESVAMGTPTVSLDRALALAGALEDDELIRKMRAHG